MRFTRSMARATSIIEFRHTDGTIQGGVVVTPAADTFGVVSHPRYGDTKSRRFRYEDVAEVHHQATRACPPLSQFDRLMRGVR